MIRADELFGVDQSTAQSLVIPFFVIMSGVLGDGSSKRAFSKEDQPAQTLLFDRSQAELNKIALRLNQRPRKTLGFRCPAERLDEIVALTA